MRSASRPYHRSVGGGADPSGRSDQQGLELTADDNTTRDAAELADQAAPEGEPPAGRSPADADQEPVVNMPGLSEEPDVDAPLAPDQPSARDQPEEAAQLADPDEGAQPDAPADRGMAAGEATAADGSAGDPSHHQLAPDIAPADEAPAASPTRSPATVPDVEPGSIGVAPAAVAEATMSDPLRPLPKRDASQWLDATCPFLRSTDGTWRSVVPQRGQRCWGQAPPAPLEPITQERLCRTIGHKSCEIFIAAEATRYQALRRDHVVPERLEGRFGTSVRPAPLVLDEPSGARTPIPVHVSMARRARVAVGVALAGGVVLVALFAGLGGGAAPTPTQPPIAFVTPTPLAPSPPPATSQPVPSESLPPATQVPATPVVSPPPSQTPGPSSSPRIRTKYRVQRSDTLDKIAAKFGVTKKQIRAVNNLGDPPRLFFGQVINIPYP